MRTLSAGLATAQKASSVTPAIKVNLPDYNGGLDISAYLKRLDHIEQTYGGSATLVFGDTSNWYISGGGPINLIGQQVDISYGAEVASTPDYTGGEAAPLWVRNPRLIELEGTLAVQLDCFDIWQKLQTLRIMGDSVGKPSGYDGDTTIYDIIESMLTGVTTLTKDSSDGLIDTIMPNITYQLNDDIADIVAQLMAMTFSGIRMRRDGMHIFALPLDYSGANTYDISTPDYVFHSSIYDDEVAMPNKIIVVDQYPTADTDYEFSGSAIDTNSYSALGYYITRIYAIPDVTSNSEAEQRAEAILNAIQQSLSRGIIIVPHHCGQELGDIVKVVSSRWP